MGKKLFYPILLSYKMHKVLLIPMYVFLLGKLLVHLLDMMIQKGLVLSKDTIFWGGEGDRIHYCWSNPFGKIERVGKQIKIKMCIISWLI
jgi:hypothetical protein